jgi:hypothetical protein
MSVGLSMPHRDLIGRPLSYRTGEAHLLSEALDERAPILTA